VTKIRFAIIFCTHQIRPKLQSLPWKASSPSSHGAAFKRGVLLSIKDLKAAINRFVAKTNAKPEPFRTADTRRCTTWKTSLESIH
jgi:hypothetical protein